MLLLISPGGNVSICSIILPVDPPSSNVETIEVRHGNFAKQTLHKPFRGLVDLLKEGFPATMNPDDSWSRWD
jgi:hypothetical protein